MIPNDIPRDEMEDIHRCLEPVCGFWDKRRSPVLSRVTGEVVHIQAIEEYTIITVADGQNVKDHKITPSDPLLEKIIVGAEVHYGEPLSRGTDMPFCRLQAAWAFQISRQNGHSTLAYEKIARLTGVPKSSVFQSERIGLDLLQNKIAPFVDGLKERAREDESGGNSGSCIDYTHGQEYFVDST